MDQSRFTIIIPSKIIDRNLINCEKKIRQYYKEIKILLALDEINDNTEFSVHTNKIITGLYSLKETYNKDNDMEARIDAIILTLIDFKNKIQKYDSCYLKKN